MFTDKLNKASEPYQIEEDVTINGGLYDSPLKHDNVVRDSVVVLGGNGLPISTFTLEQSEDKEWETVIRIHTSQTSATIFYESMGDTVDADDVNTLNEKTDRNQTTIKETQKKISDLDNKVNEGTSDLKALIENHESDLQEVGGRLTHLERHKASKDDLQSDKIEHSPGWSVYDELGRKAYKNQVDEELQEKANREHNHSLTDVQGLGSKLSDMWVAINNKAFIDHTHLPANIYLNAQGDTLGEISAKHIDFDGYSTVEDRLKSLQVQIDESEGGGGGCQVDDRVIPRETNSPSTNEITITERLGKAFEYEISKVSEGIKQDGNKFNFTSTEGYSDINMDITNGFGELKITFSDVGGYYSVTHNKVNGDKDSSGWIKENKTQVFHVNKGDSLRISTGSTLTVEIGSIPTTSEKLLMFEGDTINEKADLTEINQDIANIKGDIKGKADKEHTHKASDVVDNSLSKTQDTINKDTIQSIKTLSEQIDSAGKVKSVNKKVGDVVLTGTDIMTSTNSMTSIENSFKAHQMALGALTEDIELSNNYTKPSAYKDDMDDLVEMGRYYVTSTATNKPTPGGWFVDVYVANVQVEGHLHIFQVAYKMTSNKETYARNRWEGRWQQWQRIDGIDKAERSYVDDKLKEKANSHHSHNTFDINDPEMGKTQLMINRDLKKEIDGLKSSGVEINKTLVDALNSMGISASTSDTINTNANKVRSITNNGSLNRTISMQNGAVNISPGYYTGGQVKANITNLVASNIKKGVSVGGVYGSYAPRTNLSLELFLEKSKGFQETTFTIPFHVVSGTVTDYEGVKFDVITGKVLEGNPFSLQEAKMNGNRLEVKTLEWSGLPLKVDLVLEAY